MIKPLHPTLKKCKCGFTGSRHALYKHFELFKNLHTGDGTSFFDKHGEVPLNIDDPVFLNKSNAQDEVIREVTNLSPKEVKKLQTEYLKRYSGTRS